MHEKMTLGGREFFVDMIDVKPSPISRADLGVRPLRVVPGFQVEMELRDPDALYALVRQVQAEEASRREALLRELLGRWASELEPVVAIDQASGQVLGLAVAGDPSGRIVVAVEDLAP